MSVEATPLQTTFYKEQKRQMKIRIVGHRHEEYEAECIAMLFFPDCEKIVTTEYPADEEEHEELPLQQEQKAPAEDLHRRPGARNGLMKVTLVASTAGKSSAVPHRPVRPAYRPMRKAEYVMSDMMLHPPLRRRPAPIRPGEC